MSGTRLNNGQVYQSWTAQHYKAGNLDPGMQNLGKQVFENFWELSEPQGMKMLHVIKILFSKHSSITSS